MAYEIILFDAEAAPATASEFSGWVRAQTTWDESGDQPPCLDPKTTAPGVREWFMEILRPFPPLHGPYALPGWHDKPGATDYFFASHLALAEFPSDMNEDAFQKCMELAQKHRLGLYDAGSLGEVWMPREGELHAVALTVGRVITPRKEKEEAGGGLLGRLGGRLFGRK